MMRIRRLWRLLVAALTVVTLAGLSPALVGGPSAQAQTTQTWAAVAEGMDGAAWYINPEPLPASGATWTSLGGIVLTTPAVADYGNNPYGDPVPIFVAIGADHQVWVTSVGSAPAWYPVGGYCLSGPAANILNTASGGMDDLSIACEGSDGAMWVEQVFIEPVGPVHNPVPVQILQGWTSFGGIIAAGPAIDALPLDAGPIYFVEAPNHQVFYATRPNSWTATPWLCTGHLAGGTFNNNVLGCRGVDGQMWLLTSSNGSPTGLVASPQGGILIGGPGLASLPSPWMFAEGIDHSGYYEVAGTTPWFRLGGYLLGDGINATVLGP